MNERLNSYDRPTIKKYFQARFGDMLEKDELQNRLGKNADIDSLVRDKKIMCLWPGENMPVFPYFQLNKGRLRPEIELVLKTIDEASQNTFYSPAMFCQWIFSPVREGSKLTPLILLKREDGQKRLLKEAERFGKRLQPKVPR